MSESTAASSLINMHNEITLMKVFMTNEIMEDPEVFPSGPAAGSLVIASANMGSLLNAFKDAIDALGGDYTADNLGPIGDLEWRG